MVQTAAAEHHLSQVWIRVTAGSEPSPHQSFSTWSCSSLELCECVQVSTPLPPPTPHPAGMSTDGCDLSSSHLHLLSHQLQQVNVSQVRLTSCQNKQNISDKTLKEVKVCVESCRSSCRSCWTLSSDFVLRFSDFRLKSEAQQSH